MAGSCSAHRHYEPSCRICVDWAGDLILEQQQRVWALEARESELVATKTRLLEILQCMLHTDDSPFRLSDDSWTVCRSSARAELARAAEEKK